MGSIRIASSLILVAASEGEVTPKVLTIKRGSDVNYLPNACAFPGGNFDEGDEHVDWLSIIPSEEQEAYSKTVTSSPTSVPRTLSQRITAIRETFEECGILLCKLYNSPKSDKIIPVFVNDANGWRRKIFENAYEFLNLCRSYRCYPDVNNLHLVSRWLTAPDNPRRYDCRLFLAVCDRVVDGEVDAVEVQSMEWQPFDDCYKDKQVFVPPPPLYELSRFGKFQDINSLLEFVKNLDNEKCDSVISPLHVTATDGYITLLPGDEKYDQYRSEDNYFVEVDEDVLSYRGKIMNRIEYQPNYHPASKREVVIQNYPPLADEISSSIGTKL